MGLKKMDIKELTGNAWHMIGDDWMLVTAKDGDRVNTMTASWGGVGIMWAKTVATAYLRPQRYTKVFVDKGDTFTLSFFGGKEKKALGYLGSVSGKDEPDKIKKTDLHVELLSDAAVTFEEAVLVLVCKKLYAQEMKPECFFDQESLEKWYPDKDYHTMYIAEITEAYVRE